jgi:hypothetical protein
MGAYVAAIDKGSIVITLFLSYWILKEPFRSLADWSAAYVDGFIGNYVEGLTHFALRKALPEITYLRRFSVSASLS